jgi:hypothetical protein
MSFEGKYEKGNNRSGKLERKWEDKGKNLVKE